MSMPKPIADFQTYLTAAMSPAATTFTIFDVEDDSGTSLDGKTVWFVIDSERVLATVVAATKTCTVVLRGVDPNVSTEEVTALKVQHEKGAPVRITDAHYLLQATEMLSGDIPLQGIPTLPAARTISSARQLVDKEYSDAQSIATFADFATVDAGGLNIDVNAGTLVTDDGVIEYAGSSAVAMTDASTNYVQLTPAGTLVVNTTGWINGYVPLSKVVTAGGDITSISLKRGLITSPAGDKNITTDFTYGDTIAAGDVLFLDIADGKWKLADASVSATVSGRTGIALDAGVNNDTNKRVQIDGVVDILSGLTPGYVYVSDTAGDLSATPGTVSKAVGRAITATKLVLMDTFNVARLTGVNANATTAHLNESMDFFATTDATGAEQEVLTGGPGSAGDNLHSHMPQFGLFMHLDTGTSGAELMAFGYNDATIKTFNISLQDTGSNRGAWNGWHLASDFGRQFYTVATGEDQSRTFGSLGGTVLIGTDNWAFQAAGLTGAFKNNTAVTYSGTARGGAASYDAANDRILLQYSSTKVAKFSGSAGTTITNTSSDVTLDTAVDVDKAFIYDNTNARYIFIDTTANIIRRFNSVGVTIDTVPYTVIDTNVKGLTVINGRVCLINALLNQDAGSENYITIEFIATTMTL